MTADPGEQWLQGGGHRDQAEWLRGKPDERQIKGMELAIEGARRQ